jgi:hypothetical protein
MRTTSEKTLSGLGADRRKLGGIVRTGGTVVLAALLVALSLPVWTGPAWARSAEDTTSPRADSPGQGKTAWLRIMAFTDAPVVGADVRVYLHGSQPRPSIEMPAATNNQGVVPVAVKNSLFQSRARARITISGGTTNGQPFLGHLSADVVLDDPAHQVVVLNPVTTLVSVLLDKRPNLKLDRAQARVRSFLGLPAGYGLGLALRESPGYGSPFFSPAVLMAHAEAAGGLSSLQALLLQELLASPSATHPFLNPMPKAPGGTAKFIAKNLAAGVLFFIGGHGIGWVTEATGIIEPEATAADIADLQQGLADLQSSVDALSSQVAQLTLLVQSTATQTQYTTIVVPASNLAAIVTGVHNRLQYFAQECPPLTAGSPPSPPSNYCATEKKAITAELNDVTIYTAYDVLVNDVQDNPAIGFNGMLHLYSLWLAQSKAFFRPADSTAMQNLYDYWEAMLTAAANLKVELLHQEGEQDAGGVQLIALMGNPDLIPPTTGTFQADQDENLGLMFPAVPPDTVVSTTDHTMWALLPWVVNFAEGRTWPEPYCSYRFSPLADSQVTQGYAGFHNWLGAPTKAMWQAAVSRAPAMSTGTSWGMWLNSETLANAPEFPTSYGFSYSCGVDSLNQWYWTSTLASTNVYSVISLMSDRFSTTDPLPNYDSESRPNYNISHPVRTLESGEQYFWYH